MKKYIKMVVCKYTVPVQVISVMQSVLLSVSLYFVGGDPIHSQDAAFLHDWFP